MDKIPFTIYDIFAYMSAGVLLLVSADVAFSLGFIHRETIPLGLLIAFLILSYIVGHALAQVSSISLESGLLCRVLGAPEGHLLGDGRPSGWKRLFPGLFRPLPPETLVLLRRRALAEGQVVPSDSFFLYCREKAKTDPITWGRMDIYLNLYGFSRNVTMSFLLSTCLFLGTGLYSAWRTPCGQQSVFLLGLSLLSLALGTLMLYRYLKFMRLYSKEVLVSYAVQASGGTSET